VDLTNHCKAWPSLSVFGTEYRGYTHVHCARWLVRGLAVRPPVEHFSSSPIMTNRFATNGSAVIGRAAGGTAPYCNQLSCFTKISASLCIYALVFYPTMRRSLYWESPTIWGSTSYRGLKINRPSPTLVEDNS
jgi:hypothetical protein